jgi:hypothetical protein
LAAGTGASLRDLMARMGHGSMRAALIYQHVTAHADRQIGELLGTRIEAQRGRAVEPSAAEAGHHGRQHEPASGRGLMTAAQAVHVRDLR